MALYQGSPFLDDVALHRDGVIRIYDILFDYDVLLDTDAFVREVIQGAEFQRTMGTDEFHYLLGEYVSERGRQTEVRDSSVLAAGLRMRHSCFHQQPGDSSIGMNVAAMAMRDSGCCSMSIAMSIKRRPLFMRPSRAGANRPFSFWAAGRPKISCCKPSRKSRKSWASRRKGTIIFCNAPTRGPTPGG